MKESKIEDRLRKGVERAGGRCLKFVSPGHTGVPDRIILMPGGRVYFAETKAPGEKERPRQEYVQRKLAELGFKTYATVDTFERVLDVLGDLVADQDERRSGGLFECFHCGARAVGWDSDFTAEEMGYAVSGLVHICTCHNCGAQIEYLIPDDEGEGGQG